MWAHTLQMDVPYATCSPTGTFWDHVNGCNTCGTAFKTARHDRVVSALNSAARRYGVVSSTNFFSNFGSLPHEDKPDIVFYRTSDEKKALVVDVTVRHTNQTTYTSAIDEGCATKIAHYKDWFPDDVEFHPLPFSAVANIPTRSMDILKEISLYGLSGFAQHAVRRIKCAIVACASLRRRVLAARFGTRSAQQQSSVHQRVSFYKCSSPSFFKCAVACFSPPSLPSLLFQLKRWLEFTVCDRFKGHV